MAKGKLSDYSAKRSFTATPEPGPVPVEGREGPLMFVIQQHSATRLHYDFRIECDGVLMSWAVPKGPSLDPPTSGLAVRTEDHPVRLRLVRGNHPQGPVRRGRGHRLDCGVFSPDEDDETWFHDRARAEQLVREGMEAGKLSLLLRGEKTKGSFALVRTKDSKNWLLIKHKDRFVKKGNLTEQDRSVLSGATVEEMTSVPAYDFAAERLVPGGDKRPLPDKLLPMHAEIGDAVFNSADWMWEPKLDGYRALALIDGEDVKLRSRRGLDLGKDFPKLLAELAKQAVNGMVLDGEIVAFDESGKPSFGAMQNRGSGAERVVFYAFDLLYFAGVDLRKAPYSDRRRYLAQCLLPSPLVQLVHAEEDGVALHKAAMANGFEGVIGKRKNSTYEAGKRSAAWLKVKAANTADFVVGGYTKGKGSRTALGALLLGYWEGRKLRFASHVGSGFDDKTLARTKKALLPLQRKTNPFAEEPELNAPTTWVEPKLVAEVKYQGWTHDDHLRAPVFLRLRDDIDPAKVKRAERSEPAKSDNEILAQLDNQKDALTLEVGKDRVKVTHLNRVYWPADPALKQPALTKRDLLRYFAQVAPYILPHLADRPLTMIRMPDGINGQRFFQKHWRQEQPAFVETVRVWSGSKEEEQDYIVCNNLPTLLWLAQSGTLEFHVWHSRAKPGPDAEERQHQLRCFRGGDGPVSPELPGLGGVRYRSVHLFGQGEKGRGAGVEQCRLREGQGGGVLAARAAAGHEPRRHRQDLGQDRPARLRADQAHHRLRRRAGGVRARRPAPGAPAPEGRHGRVERAQAHRQDLHGLQHERARQDVERRLFAARRPWRAGLDAPHLGGARRRPSPGLPADQRRRTSRGDRRPLERRLVPQIQPGEGPEGVQDLKNLFVLQSFPRVTSSRSGGRQWQRVRLRL
jgi:bifunctional non-homologous end joining protein LigD